MPRANSSRRREEFARGMVSSSQVKGKLGTGITKSTKLAL